jgi:hypothetical protein
LFFARRVTLGSSKIRFIVIIVRCLDRRPSWRVGKSRSGIRGDQALIGTNNSVPPVCVMHRSRVRRATQGDQKAQGQNRTHRFFSNRPRLGKAQAAPSQQIAASRLVTSVASRDLTKDRPSASRLCPVHTAACAGGRMAKRVVRARHLRIHCRGLAHHLNRRSIAHPVRIFPQEQAARAQAMADSEDAQCRSYGAQPGSQAYV